MQNRRTVHDDKEQGEKGVTNSSSVEDWGLAYSLFRPVVFQACHLILSYLILQNATAAAAAIGKTTCRREPSISAPFRKPDNPLQSEVDSVSSRSSDRLRAVLSPCIEASIRRRPSSDSTRLILVSHRRIQRSPAYLRTDPIQLNPIQTATQNHPPLNSSHITPQLQCETGVRRPISVLYLRHERCATS